MKGIVGRTKVKQIIVATKHFIYPDDPAGIISLTIAPRSKEDHKLILALLREAIKNDSWIEIGGGGGSLVDSRTATPPPLESDQPALGPIISEQ